MTNLKGERWRQRFENFEKSYLLLSKYAGEKLDNELERAGVIQFFEMTFELAWKVLKDYLESQGYDVKSPRETIKQAYQIEVIDDGHTWLEALSKRNLTAHTYDDQMAEKMVQEIKEHYYPELQKLYARLKEEV
ncbi:nucleotidyltransferase [Halobacillus trueperi]|uniref:Nucleotidyltransferase substrate binding protein, HI0074 family n=2 Tax=Halobacillus TaxID=45667 RepID=A0A1H0KIB2_HALAD|nr:MULTISPECIES: nucleotidyltransferase substrate binding protein [Halobacillus]RDY71680.1 nucleotidyltransferase [Halobacillus trueperi]SDO55510.1 nucleotidyltransferase substrate binding protein, HI0074 family [Halobacillus aidingensis]